MLGQGVLPLIDAKARARQANPHLDFKDEVPNWINPDWAARLGLRDRWRAETLGSGLPSFAQRQRYHVYAVARTHLSQENVVNYAASRGIELRHPFHDFRLTRFLMGAAGHMLQGHGQYKYILREAMRGTLPEIVRTRPTKANFVPTLIDAVSDCLEQRSAHDLLCVQMGWVDGDHIARAQRLYSDWRKAGCPPPAPAIHYGAVWYAVAVDLWLRNATSA
jgi:asparagine synthase (glutamine-hydrolysing)